MDMLNTLIVLFSDKYGTVGMVLAHLLFVGPVVSILIECLEAVVTLTESTEDDEFAHKVKTAWGKVLPVLEALPHVNLPIAPVIVKIVTMMVKIAKGVIGFIKAFKE